MRITGGLRIVGGLSITDGVNTNLPVLRWNPTLSPYLPLLFSISNSRVEDTAPGSYTIIATNPIPTTGAYMFTVRMNYNIDANIPDVGGYVGIGNLNFNPDAPMGNDSNSIGFIDNGLLVYNGGILDGGYPGFNVDAVRVIDIAILDNSYMWIRVDGGDWNGNPSSDLLTGAGGVPISGYFTEIYPMVTVAGDMGPTQFDILKTSPYGVPSGVTFFNEYTTPAGPYIPTVAPAMLFVGEAAFEMGAYNPFVDPALVPDLSGNDHSMGLNDNAAGNANWYHFYNNSAQANNWDWPADNAHALTIMGWFYFGNLTSATSLVTRNEGSAGWALRVDNNGADINLVKYNDADQTITLNAPLTLNQWHFISVSQLENYLVFNIDGNTYETTGSSTPFASSGGPVRLQYDPYNGGNQSAEIYMRDVKILPFSYDASWLFDKYKTLKTGYGFSSSPVSVVVATADLGNVTSSNISGNNYNYGGSYDYIIFTGDSTLEANLQDYLGMSAGNPSDFKPFAATWASGQTGYVFMEYTSDPVVQFYPCDVSGNPIAADTYTFPVIISRV